jgi:hypothetical protein
MRNIANWNIYFTLYFLELTPKLVPVVVTEIKLIPQFQKLCDVAPDVNHNSRLGTSIRVSSLVLTACHVRHHYMPTPVPLS